MEELKKRILQEGRYLGRGILKVDAFLNHQVDPALMMACGRAFAQRLGYTRPTKVLTAEISGIAPALAAAYHLGMPLVFARKHRPITLPENSYHVRVPSPTKGGEVELWLSPEWVGPEDRVLIIDDFLASGKTIQALAQLTRLAGGRVVGVGALIEKVFQKGRENLQHLGVPIVSLVRIERFKEDGTIVFYDNDG